MAKHRDDDMEDSDGGNFEQYKQKKIKEEFEEAAPKKHKKKEKQVVEPENAVPAKRQHKRKKPDAAMNNGDNEVVKKNKKKKKRENFEEQEPVKEEMVHVKIEEDTDQPDAEDGGGEEEEFNFSIKDLPKLIDRIEAAIPENDTLAFKTRAKRLDWTLVAFNEYTPEKCRDTWFYLQKRQRQYRILSEIVNDAKQWLNRPQNESKKIHPDYPKKPLSAYLLYYLERKDQVSSQHPSIKKGELSKMIAQEYNELPEEHRLQYYNLASIKKKKYEQDVEDFYVKHPEIPRGSEKAVPEKESKKPTAAKPITPFALFVEEQLKEQTNVTDKKAFKIICKEKWNIMPERKKLVWIDWALEMERKYLSEIQDMQNKNPNFIAPSKAKMSILNKEEKHIKEKMDGKPEKPPTSAYSLFSSILLKSTEMKQVMSNERMKIIAQKWKDLSQEDKDNYRDRTALAMEQYKIEYTKYLESLPADKREEEIKNAAPKKKVKPEELPAAPLQPKIEKKEEVKEEEEPPKTVNLAETVTPNTWNDMTEGERSMYMKYIQKIKDYFDMQHQTALDHKDGSCSSDSQSDSSETDE